MILRQDKVEDLAAEGLRFDLVCSRAFAPLEPGIMAVLTSILSAGGCFFFYKGRSARIDEELHSIGLPRRSSQGAVEMADFVGNQAVVIALAVPFLAEERHIVLIRPDAGAC